MTQLLETPLAWLAESGAPGEPLPRIPGSPVRPDLEDEVLDLEMEGDFTNSGSLGSAPGGTKPVPPTDTGAAVASGVSGDGVAPPAVAKDIEEGAEDIAAPHAKEKESGNWREEADTPPLPPSPLPPLPDEDGRFPPSPFPGTPQQHVTYAPFGYHSPGIPPGGCMANLPLSGSIPQKRRKEY